MLSKRFQNFKLNAFGIECAQNDLLITHYEINYLIIERSERAYKNF